MKKEENNLFNNSNYSEQDSFSEKPIIPISLNSSHIVHRLKIQSISPISVQPYSSVSDKAYKYYHQYVKLFQNNKMLNNQLAQIIQDRNLLADKYNSIKVTLPITQRMNSTEEAVRRKRRYAKDIERLFHCPMDKCKRGYGSEGSLSHHVRLKHLQFYQSGRYQMFIQQYIDRMTSQKKKLGEKLAYEKHEIQQVKLQHQQQSQEYLKTKKRGHRSLKKQQ